MPTDYSNYGLKIAEAFQNYLRTGDDELIERYTAKQLKVAVSRLSPYYGSNKQWYRQIERRIDELEPYKNQNRFKDVLKERWFINLLIFSIGLLTGIAVF